MRFTKMQGCGNDYIYVNAMEERVERSGDRRGQSGNVTCHFGHPGDGTADSDRGIQNSRFFDGMYNADGSKGAMCGNGIRCVGNTCTSMG